MRDRWIPHLGYAVWRNPAVLQLGRFAGEAGIEFAVLVFAASCSLLLIHRKRFAALVVAVAAVAVVLVGNAFLMQAAATQVRELPIIVALQSSTPQPNADATEQVIAKLRQQTLDALVGVDRSGSQEVYVVWPENRIPPAEAPSQRSRHPPECPKTRKAPLARGFHCGPGGALREQMTSGREAVLRMESRGFRCRRPRRGSG